MQNHTCSAASNLIPTARISGLFAFIRKISIYLLISSFSFATHASVLTFDLRNSEAALILDNMNSGEFVLQGLKATFTSSPGALLNSVFNQTASRFGINTLGSTADSPSLIDAVNGLSEFLSITFSENVVLDNVVLSAFTPAERALVSIEGGAATVLAGFDTAVDVYYFSGYTINVGENLILAHVLGNGFSFDSLGVSLVSVTEPHSFALMLVAGLMILLSVTQNSHSGRPAPVSAGC